MDGDYPESVWAIDPKNGSATCYSLKNDDFPLPFLKYYKRDGVRMFKFIEKWLLGGSKKEIEQFLANFSQGDIEQNGMVMGWAALMHYHLLTINPEFDKLINSMKGKQKAAISAYILQLNQFGNGLYKEGRLEEAAGMKIWNITFRCMSDESFHQYGMNLWKIAAESFSEAQSWLEYKLVIAQGSCDEHGENSLSGALKIYNYIPPQFVETQ
jgi:hypothetical protein